LLKEGNASIAIESKICRAESIVCGIAENCFNVEEKIEALILEQFFFIFSSLLSLHLLISVLFWVKKLNKFLMNDLIDERGEKQYRQERVVLHVLNGCRTFWLNNF